MDHPLLKSRRGFWIPAFAGMTALVLIGGCLTFNDPNLELDPARIGDLTLTPLIAAEHYKVQRKFILESFGSFGCTNCPDAEGHLLPYIRADLNSPLYNHRLVVVNYHVNFGAAKDPWITAGTQVRYDQSFANSLPQVTLNGSNTAFGIRETDVRYPQGEYDSLVARLRRLDSMTYLDLRLNAVAYDSLSHKMNVRFTVFNRDSIAQSALSFHVLVVKNLPVKIPLYPNNNWEAIVSETSDKDASGKAMVLKSLAGLNSKTYSASLAITPEASDQTNPLGLENPRDYAVVVVAKNGDGVVQNVASYRYHPGTTGADAPLASTAHLEKLLYNDKWYRTFDTTADIDPNAGSLLYAWSYGDLARRPDSFYVGIDTLWTLPQNVNGDTANDWDLQVCPDGFCMNGLKVNVHGANAPIVFGDTGEFGDTSFQTEHHFQFFPAISSSYHFTAPDSSIFGAMIFVHSRSRDGADTAFAFGAWKLGWDSAYLPPLHPVAGYLPKRSDFTIVGNKVRYVH